MLYSVFLCYKQVFRKLWLSSPLHVRARALASPCPGTHKSIPKACCRYQATDTLQMAYLSPVYWSEVDNHTEKFLRDVMGLLPWKEKTQPLMLAPMQGLTNEALRSCFIERYHPDIVFTEFVRVQTQSRKRIARAELAEIKTHSAQTPLVVQLIGHDAVSLSIAAEEVQAAGCRHVNLNLGCPYGRMTTGATGGELLNYPEKLPALLKALRQTVCGSFSVKCRAGYDDPRQVFDLLSLYEETGVDYVILHPRTVQQKYSGIADHDLTREAVKKTSIPVIANGDINNAEMGLSLLSEGGVSGLMIGRGALADPLLFQRLRRTQSSEPDERQLRAELAEFIIDLIPRYLTKFCGERQALMKLKDVLNFIPYYNLQRDLGKLKRTTSMTRFRTLLDKYFLLT